MADKKKKAAEMTFDRPTYSESDAVKNAKAQLDAASASKPGDYASKYTDQLGAVMDKILNREDFSYDLNGDALYKQYKDQYALGGKMAMMDTMGQAAALTGGYGNSYASTVGNQAYQSYMQGLNDKIPELYQLAYDSYRQEGQDMLTKYGLLSEADQKDYGRHRDSVADWNAERDFAYNRYNAERDYDYSKYADDRDFSYNQFANDRNMQYQSERDAVEDNRWRKEFDEALRQYNEQFGYQKERDEVSDKRWESEFNLAKEQYEASKAGDGSGGGGNTGLEHVASMTSAEIVETMQGYQVDGDNTGLEAFLDDCVASGRLSEAQADAYYRKYRTEEKPTVPTAPTYNSYLDRHANSPFRTKQ